MNEEMVTAKRVYRSRQNRVVAGVCGGLGQYFNVDPVLFRLGFLLLGVTPGFGIILLAYLVLAIVVPQRPASEPEPEITSSMTAGRGRELAGFVLLGLGLLLLAANMGFFRLVNWDLVWPIVLIGFGALLLANHARR